MALDLKKGGFATKMIGVDKNPKHGEEALQIGFIDEVANLQEGVQQADVVILAVPVNAMRRVVFQVLDNIREDAVVFDVGSTKSPICETISDHPNRANFVACHPMAGTENTGPSAAIYQLFENKVNIICELDRSFPWAVQQVEYIFSKVLKMRNSYMNPVEHDRHIAYVSHLSHISSFTLGLTVLDIEKDEKNIFDMASTGFASTVRLAKSAASMWVPIFEENAENVTVALDAYIEQLQQFKAIIERGEFEKAYQLIEQANEIRRVLKGIELKQTAFAE